MLNMSCSDNYNIKNERLEMPEAVVVLKRIKIIACKKCPIGFTKQSEYKVHKLKHDLQNIQKKRKEKNRYIYKSSNPVAYEQKYKCDECDLKFVEMSTLIAHAALHKPFPHVCHCGVGFYDKENLNSHIKIVHEEGKAKNSKKARNVIILGSKKPEDSWNT